MLFCSLLKCCNPVISFYSYEVSNKRKLFVGSLSRSSLAPVSFQSTYDLVDCMKNKDSEENVLEEIFRKCSKKFKCFSAGIYDESGMMQCYAHFYIYLQIGLYSDLAMLCYYKVFYFTKLLAIRFTLISLHFRHQ